MTAEVATPTADVLPGRLGLVRASALYVAAVLGTGILVLPSLTARVAGPASMLSVLAVLVLSIPLAGTFAALASRFPDAGGVATFVQLALGKTASRMAGYWFFFGVAVGSPVVGILCAQYVIAAVWGEHTVAPHWLVVVIAVLIYVPPAVVNIFGVRVSGSAQIVLTVILLVVVIGVVVVALPEARVSHFTPFLPHGIVGVGVGVSLFVWAFSGWEAVTHIAGEFKNPRRTIPIATAIAIAIVGIAYLALQYVTVAVLGTQDDSTVPLLGLVSKAAPGYGSWIIAGIALVVTIGVLNIYVSAFAKLGSALGRDGHLPKWIASGSQAGQVPRRALLIVGLINLTYFVLLVATGFDLTLFILINTSCMVAVYALGMVAAVRLLERRSIGWWMAVISVVLVAGLLVLAGWHLVVPAALAVVAVLVTVFTQRNRTRERTPQ